MQNAEWIASFAAGIVAYLVSAALARVLSARLPPRSFARWREEMMRELHRRVSLSVEVADSDQRLWELAEKAPKPYRRALFENVEYAKSLPPSILAVAERVGLYRPADHAQEPLAIASTVERTEPSPSSESFAWVGSVRVPRPNGKQTNGN